MTSKCIPISAGDGFIQPIFTILFVAALSHWAHAQWPKTAEQLPRLQSLPDRSAELQSRIDAGGGNLLLDEKHYRISKTLEFDLTKHGAVQIVSQVGSTLIMDGVGPAIRLVGSHQGTASPKSFQAATWNERMPIVTGIEILGAHPQADGIELQRTVAATVSRVSVRWCQHGIHLVERNRNVTISDCHLYENSGIGVFLDDVNLHQINIGNSHISYNRSGGVVVRDGNVRNVQITGCDIEANMPGDETPTMTANVLIDVSGSKDDPSKSIAEIAITGCTIQHSANYSGSEQKTTAPGGANIRLAGKKIYPINSVTITANVMSDTTTNVDIAFAHDVTIGSNTFFAPKPNNLVVQDSQRVVVSGNTFNPRQFVRPGTIHFKNCADCIFSNSTLHKFATNKGALILEGCQGCSLTGLSLTDCGSGIVLRDTSNTTIAGCRVSRTSQGADDLDLDSTNQNIRLHENVFTGSQSIDETAHDN
ncbi:MAG: right-handed parallel beta-helix repeat-containing protein [Rubripirellula sp.]